MPSRKASETTLIHTVATSNMVDETGQMPVQQVTYMGKVSKAMPWWPYGFDASVPDNELAVALSVGGNTDSKVFLAGSPGKGPEKEPGEVVFYHPATGSKVHFKEDGSIELVAGGSSITLSPTVGITITPVSGQAVTIEGDLTVTGSTAVQAITSVAKDIGATHTHLGSATAPVGAISNTGIPV